MLIHIQWRLYRAGRVGVCVRARACVRVTVCVRVCVCALACLPACETGSMDSRRQVQAQRHSQYHNLTEPDHNTVEKRNTWSANPRGPRRLTWYWAMIDTGRWCWTDLGVALSVICRLSPNLLCRRPPWTLPGWVSAQADGVQANWVRERWFWELNRGSAVPPQTGLCQFNKHCTHT